MAVLSLRIVSGGDATHPVKPEQLTLFQELPCSPPPFWSGAEVREIRQQINKTQDWLATRLDIRRSHVANSERDHDRLSVQRRRLLQHVIETERLDA